MSATRVAGICSRYFQAHRFEKTRPTISCRALALKKISWKNHKNKEEETAQEQREQQGSLRFMARALM